LANDFENIVAIKEAAGDMVQSNTDFKISRRFLVYKG
jgi:dihydrodipicolinate synthase/N-acetylneuraminate lyase